MSGGYFNMNPHFIIESDVIPSIVRKLIINNACGETLEKETFDILLQSIIEMRKTADVINKIDYYFSGDYDQDSFL